MFPLLEMNKSPKFLLLLSAAIGLAIAGGAPFEHNSLDAGIVAFADGDVDYRLGYKVYPIKYELEITPYFADVSVDEGILGDGP